MAQLLVDNDNDVVLKNYRLASTGADVSDAVLSFTLYEQDGETVVPGFGSVSMPYTGAGGTYRGLLSGSAPLTKGTRYKLVVAAANYNDRWEAWFTAAVRTL